MTRSTHTSTQIEHDFFHVNLIEIQSTHSHTRNTCMHDFSTRYSCLGFSVWWCSAFELGRVKVDRWRHRLIPFAWLMVNILRDLRPWGADQYLAFYGLSEWFRRFFTDGVVLSRREGRGKGLSQPRMSHQFVLCGRFVLGNDWGWILFVWVFCSLELIS